MQRYVLLLTLTSALPAQPGRFGQPACLGPDVELVDHGYFAICHSGRFKTPLWAGHELRPLPPDPSAARPSRFRRDKLLSGPAARNADYLGSGFSRGHMVPAADVAWSAEALRSTFVLSNTVPQRRVNFGRWAQLEAAVRRLASSGDAAYVFTGPLFDSPAIETIGAGRISVPTHTYKVVLMVTRAAKTMYAAIIPNADHVTAPLDDFATTVDELERRTGLDFFAALDDTEEAALEARRAIPPPAAKRTEESRRCGNNPLRAACRCAPSP